MDHGTPASATPLGAEPAATEPPSGAPGDAGPPFGAAERPGEAYGAERSGSAEVVLEPHIILSEN